jgi:plasmid maintenance system antidote protein VapI
MPRKIYKPEEIIAKLTKRPPQRKETKDAQSPAFSSLLEDAAQQRGSRAALARDLGLDAREVARLINSERFVTMRQALAIEKVLGLRAEGLFYEASRLKIDEALVRGQRSDREAAE